MPHPSSIVEHTRPQKSRGGGAGGGVRRCLTPGFRRLVAGDTRSGLGACARRKTWPFLQDRRSSRAAGKMRPAARSSSGDCVDGDDGSRGGDYYYTYQRPLLLSAIFLLLRLSWRRVPKHNTAALNAYFEVLLCLYISLV